MFYCAILDEHSAEIKLRNSFTIFFLFYFSTLHRVIYKLDCSIHYWKCLDEKKSILWLSFFFFFFFIIFFYQFSRTVYTVYSRCETQWKHSQNTEMFPVFVSFFHFYVVLVLYVDMPRKWKTFTGTKIVLNNKLKWNVKLWNHFKKEKYNEITYSMFNEYVCPFNLLWSFIFLTVFFSVSSFTSFCK